MFIYLKLLILILVLGSGGERSPTPIVMWHGMGDSCCMPYSLGPFKQFLESHIPNVYVKSIRIGNNVIEDLESGYFTSPNKQVDIVCQQIIGDEKLKNGFHMLGFSQGGQFLRAVVQRCGHRLPQVLNLITLGGQHQGVYGLPNCAALNHATCNEVRKLLNHAAYLRWVQDYLVQATYWHDPLNEDVYRMRSHFLADINNENTINTTYIQNLYKLKRFVMVKFDADTIVQPVDTEWFGFYKPGSDKQMEQLIESRLYTEDRLGLRKMNRESRLVFLSSPGNHLKFTDEWFIDNILKPYLI